MLDIYNFNQKFYYILVKKKFLTIIIFYKIKYIIIMLKSFLLI